MSTSFSAGVSFSFRTSAGLFLFYRIVALYIRFSFIQLFTLCLLCCVLKQINTYKSKVFIFRFPFQIIFFGTVFVVAVYLLSLWSVFNQPSIHTRIT